MKNKIMAVVLIGLLATAGLVLAGCGANCPGNGECTVTIDQGTSGLYVSSDGARSSCGKSRETNYDGTEKKSGCKVQNNIDGYKRSYGKQSCDC